MDVIIDPHPLSGSIEGRYSKSVAHRALILAACSDGTSEVEPDLVSASEDIKATWRCLESLGCRMLDGREVSLVVPLQTSSLPRRPLLDVGESGSTLRFLLSVVAALGCGATFACHGRLAERPLSPLDEQLQSHGMRLHWASRDTLVLEGRLTGGTFHLPGNVSSQYVSGLLMAAPLVDGAVEVVVSDPVESRGYIDLTIDELARFGVPVIERPVVTGGSSHTTFCVPAGASMASPGRLDVERDWSNAAFWLVAGALGTHSVAVRGLKADSRQGDRAIVEALAELGATVGFGTTADTCEVVAGRAGLHGCDIDIAHTPDLAAPLATVVATAQGTTQLTGAARLRLKESDRMETIAQAIRDLGGHARTYEDRLAIEGVERLRGGDVDAANDHRIAMMAAICGAYAQGPTRIHGAECVRKSYPTFFEDFRALGGVCTPVS